MIQLPNITLLGADGVDIDRLIKAAEISMKDIEFGDVKMLSHLPSASSLVQKIPEIFSIEEYSRFMIKDLNDYFDTDFVLVIQYDGFILNSSAWSDEFLKYDYIGAPWWYEDDCNVGNGGFSLRSKKLQKLLQTDSHIEQVHPEDHRICRTYGEYLRSKGIRFAPQEVAERFAIEGYLACKDDRKERLNSVWTNEFGFHGLHKTDISVWKGFESF